jgi:hypothetical protein
MLVVVVAVFKISLHALLVVLVVVVLVATV